MNGAAEASEAAPEEAWSKVIEDASPYVDWWWTARGDEMKIDEASGQESLSFQEGGLNFIVPTFLNGDSGRENAGGSEEVDDNKPIFAQSASAESFGDRRYVPVPEQMLNKDWKASDQWITDDFVKRLPEAENIPENAIVVGVIDTGAPLSHRRTMRHTKDGLRTRIAASWQQSADRTRETLRPGEDALPYGRELTGPEIDNLLAAHTCNGAIDEDAFNRAAQLVEPGMRYGQRDLDFRAAHGAHILDLAGGYDPVGQKDLADRIMLIIVNLPSQGIHGTAGHFLQYFASFAIERIRAVSRALYLKKFAGGQIDAQVKGFPTLINLSYGMQAGPKDGSLPFEGVARDLIRRRGVLLSETPSEVKPTAAKLNTLSPDEKDELLKNRRRTAMLRIAMPVGNNNLDRTTAHLELPKDEVRGINWRILPEDQTANFLEIWTDALPVDTSPPRPQDFDLWVTPPGEAPVRIRPPKQNPETDERYSRKLRLGPGEGYGRFYCRVANFSTRPQGVVNETMRRRIQFLIALRPTAIYGEPPMNGDDSAGSSKPLAPAPAGLWRVELRCRTRKTAVGLHVQSDQSLEIQNGGGLSSYLDDRNYRHFEPSGRLRDSFSYDRVFGEASEYLEAEQGPVRRAGSSNALASTRYIRVFGGHRRNDGRPADYASTALLEPDFDEERRGADVSFPTDDGAAHYGVLGSGSRDGSTVAYRGASMATALSTRYLAEAVWAGDRDDLDERGAFGGAWLRWNAECVEKDATRRHAPSASAKTGAGRLDAPETYLLHRASRLG